MATTPTVDVISLSEIRENPVALRAVNREDEVYIGLRDSVRAKGILNPISVRLREEVVDDVKINYFEILDGLHRYTAAIDAGLTDIPVNIVSLAEAEVLEAQIMANVHKIETRPVQYTQQLKRIFAANPALTVAEMAAKVCKSPSWISQRLGLLKLEKTLQALVDDGKITVSNAVILAKLPHDEQINYVDQAMSMGADEFAPTIQARVAELRAAARQGREAVKQFTPIARLRKLSELKLEFENRVAGPQLCSQQNLTGDKATAAFNLGVAYAICLDPASIAVQQAKFEERQKTQEEEKKKRAADRAKKKAAEAQQTASEAAAAYEQTRK